MATAYQLYKNQDYNKLKNQCLENGKLFEDPEFPATSENIIRFNTLHEGCADNLVWKRPGELTYFLDGLKPEFVVNKIDIRDLDQGTLGDCWLISSMANICQYPEYANVVIPQEGQTFIEGQYAGIFHFRIWKWGTWYDIVVDDRIPVSAEGIPQYCHNNKDPNEFFGPLLEKAFAKIAGCYEALICGDADDGMIDLSGGIHECFDLTSCRLPTFVHSQKDFEQENVRTDKSSLWEILFHAKQMKSLVGTFTKKPVSTELMANHAYSVLSVYEILAPEFDRFRENGKEKKAENSIKLVLVRNPWGMQTWSGAWGSQSAEWSCVNAEIKEALIADETEGEFLMSFDDFIANFEELRCVHTDLNAFMDDPNKNEQQAQWKTKQFSSAWLSAISSGGCGNDGMDLYWTNPQLYVNIPQKQALIISLMNTESERLKLENHGNFLASNPPIHFTLYRVNDSRGSPKAYKYLGSTELTQVGSTGVYTGKREISRRFELLAGDYVIVPSQFTSHVSLKFLLRLSTQGQIVACELTSKPQKKSEDMYYGTPPKHLATGGDMMERRFETHYVRNVKRQEQPSSVACSIM